jgi:protein gp37
MTWNPVTGCTKISPGCKHCYAETMAKRLKAMGSARYENGFKLALQDDLVELPLKWKSPRVIFVNSMSDLFQEKIPLEFIQRVFDTMRRCPQHQFQILTKRAERLVEVAHELEWSKNICLAKYRHIYVFFQSNRYLGELRNCL